MIFRDRINVTLESYQFLQTSNILFMAFTDYKHNSPYKNSNKTEIKKTARSLTVGAGL